MLQRKPFQILTLVCILHTKFLQKVVSLVGFEPTTTCLEGRCSIRLSYREK